MTFTRFRIYVRDRPNSAFQLPVLGEIDTYTSFEAQIRLLDIGSFQIVIPTGTDQADLIRPGRGILVYLADGTSDPVFTGPIRSIKLTRTGVGKTNGYLTVSGTCDNKLLDERVGRGTPRLPWNQEGWAGFGRDTTIPPQIDWKPVVYDGSIERSPNNSAEFIWGLVHENFVISTPDAPNPTVADLSRRVKYLNVPRTLPASLMAMPADAVWKGFPTRQNSIADTVFALAAAMKLNVRLKWKPSTGMVHLDITQVVDRSNTVVFDQTAGNLVGYEFTTEIPEATRVILVGATSSTTNPRRYYEYQKNDLHDPSGWLDYDNGGSSSSWSDPGWGRQAIETQWNVSAEAIVDVRESKWTYQSDPAYPGTALAPTAGSAEAALFASQELASLAEKGAKGAFTLDAADIEGCRFSTDYDIGDIVRALLDTSYLPDTLRDADGVLREQVREVRLASSGTEAWRIQPTVGASDGSTTPYIYRELRRLRKRIEAAQARE